MQGMNKYECPALHLILFWLPYNPPIEGRVLSSTPFTMYRIIIPTGRIIVPQLISLHIPCLLIGLFLLFSLPLSQANVLPLSPSSPHICGAGGIAPVNLQDYWTQEEHCYDLAGSASGSGGMMTM